MNRDEAVIWLLFLAALGGFLILAYLFFTDMIAVVTP